MSRFYAACPTKISPIDRKKEIYVRGYRKVAKYRFLSLHKKMTENQADNVYI